MTARTADPTGAGTGERRYGGRTADERRAERRERLLGAGLDVFARVGFQASTIEQLCVEAKVATRNFYEEFESKEALIIELHDSINDQAVTAVATALDRTDPGDIEARVRAGFESYLDVMTDDPRWARLAFIEMTGATPGTHRARRRALARFAELIAAEADRLATLGIIQVRDHTLKATAVVGALTALVETWTIDGDRHRQRTAIADEATNLLLLVLTDSKI